MTASRTVVLAALLATAAAAPASAQRFVGPSGFLAPSATEIGVLAGHDAAGAGAVLAVRHSGRVNLGVRAAAAYGSRVPFPMPVALETWASAHLPFTRLPAVYTLAVEAAHGPETGLYMPVGVVLTRGFSAGPVHALAFVHPRVGPWADHVLPNRVEADLGAGGSLSWRDQPWALRVTGSTFGSRLGIGIVHIFET